MIDFQQIDCNKKKKGFLALSQILERTKQELRLSLTEEKNQRESRLRKWIKTDGAVLFIAYKVFL